MCVSRTPENPRRASDPVDRPRRMEDTVRHDSRPCSSVRTPYIHSYDHSRMAAKDCSTFTTSDERNDGANTSHANIQHNIDTGPTQPTDVVGRSSKSMNESESTSMKLERSREWFASISTRLFQPSTPKKPTPYDTTLQPPKPQPAANRSVFELGGAVVARVCDVIDAVSAKAEANYRPTPKNKTIPSDAPLWIVPTPSAPQSPNSPDIAFQRSIATQTDAQTNQNTPDAPLTPLLSMTTCTDADEDTPTLQSNDEPSPHKPTPSGPTSLIDDELMMPNSVLGEPKATSDDHSVQTTPAEPPVPPTTSMPSLESMNIRTDTITSACIRHDEQPALMPTCNGSQSNTDDMMQTDDSPIQTKAISKSRRKRIQHQRSKLRAQNYLQMRMQAANIIARAARRFIIRQRHARDTADTFWTQKCFTAFVSTIQQMRSAREAHAPACAATFSETDIEEPRADQAPTSQMKQPQQQTQQPQPSIPDRMHQRVALARRSSLEYMIHAIFKVYSDEEQQFEMFQMIIDFYLQHQAELHPDTRSENMYDDSDTTCSPYARHYSVANDDCIHEACQGDVIINIQQLPNNSIDCNGNGDISDAGDHHSFHGYSSDNHSDYGDSENNSQYSRSDHDDPDHYSLYDHSYHDDPDQYSSCDYSGHGYSDYGNPDDYDSYQYSNYDDYG